VWTTTTSGSTVTTSTVTNSTPPPFVFSFYQPTSSGSFPATVNATLMGSGNYWATNTYTYNGPIYQFSGAGTQGSISNPQQGYIVGPAFSAGIASGASLWNTGASFAPPSKTSLAGTPSVLTISSNGAPGADPGNSSSPGGGSYNAGAGGSVSITQNATLLEQNGTLLEQNGTLLLSVAETAIPSGVDIKITPWSPIGSAILATSQGGVGSDSFYINLGPGAGDDGGDITLTTSAGSTIAIANNADAGTVNGITAYSAGNDGGVNYDNSNNEGLLKKTDPLRRSLFQQPRVDKLASIRAINDCYNC